MNFFELFEIPVQLKVDAAGLGTRFFELSRKYHPDYFAQSSGEEQVEALEKSALLNKAYQTFKSPDETIRYVLKLKGLLEDEEKYDLPPGFLMEVMEINEQLMDADDAAVRTSVSVAIDNLQNEIYAPVKEIVEGYQEGVTSEEELLRVKAYYYQKKYIDRIRRELAD